MPIIKSAKKRVKQTEKATIRNAKTKRTLREAVKAFTKALAAGNRDEIAKAQSEAYSAIDTAAKKNLMHKNKAARRKSQLNTQAKAAAGEAKPKAAAKKPVAKKAEPAKKATPVKKTAAKPTAKKTEAKKPTAKKAPAKKTADKK